SRPSPSARAATGRSLRCTSRSACRTNRHSERSYGPDMTQAARAELFRRLHHEPPPLVLANAWDVASARIVERAGARAIATSSAAVCWALGYRDGQEIPRDEMLGWVGRIVRAVDLPLTADLEG